MCNHPSSASCWPQVPVSVSAAPVTHSGHRGVTEGAGDHAPLEPAPERWGWMLHLRFLLQRQELMQHPKLTASGHPQMQMKVKVPIASQQGTGHRLQLLFPLVSKETSQQVTCHFSACGRMLFAKAAVAGCAF